MATPDDAPLVLTLSVAADTQARFEALRRRHFPAGRNLVPAHATLFHALPPDGAEIVAEALAPFGTAAFAVRVAGLRSLGRGVAFVLESAPLRERRSAVRRALAERLTRQDASAWHPHVTIQNKVAPREASDLLAFLAADFMPFDTEAAGIHLWRYLGGPWSPVLSITLRS